MFTPIYIGTLRHESRLPLWVKRESDRASVRYQWWGNTSICWATPQICCMLMKRDIGTNTAPFMALVLVDKYFGANLMNHEDILLFGHHFWKQSCKNCKPHKKWLKNKTAHKIFSFPLLRFWRLRTSFHWPFVGKEHKRALHLRQALFCNYLYKLIFTRETFSL